MIHEQIYYGKDFTQFKMTYDVQSTRERPSRMLDCFLFECTMLKLFANTFVSILSSAIFSQIMNILTKPNRIKFASP